VHVHQLLRSRSDDNHHDCGSDTRESTVLLPTPTDMNSRMITLQTQTNSNPVRGAIALPKLNCWYARSRSTAGLERNREIIRRHLIHTTSLGDNRTHDIE
jgi:hypothetical protein